MSELRKDLLNILTKEVVRWGDDAETRKPGAYFLAARLEELGYVKVVRCGECRCRKPVKTDSGEYYKCRIFFNDILAVRGDQYCALGSKGEPTDIFAGERVADATGEEVPDGR